MRLGSPVVTAAHLHEPHLGNDSIKTGKQQPDRNIGPQSPHNLGDELCSGGLNLFLFFVFPLRVFIKASTSHTQPDLLQ